MSPLNPELAKALRAEHRISLQMVSITDQQDEAMMDSMRAMTPGELGLLGKRISAMLDEARAAEDHERQVIASLALHAFSLAVVRLSQEAQEGGAP